MRIECVSKLVESFKNESFAVVVMGLGLAGGDRFFFGYFVNFDEFFREL